LLRQQLRLQIARKLIAKAGDTRSLGVTLRRAVSSASLRYRTEVTDLPVVRRWPLGTRTRSFGLGGPAFLFARFGGPGSGLGSGSKAITPPVTPARSPSIGVRRSDPRRADEHEVPVVGTALSLERTTGFEPATPTLARWCSTAEPRPRGTSSLGAPGAVLQPFPTASRSIRTHPPRGWTAAARRPRPAGTRARPRPPAARSGPPERS
jgi:hypothetical protein